ncbi:Uncharacterised protein [Mycobacteroides abscessus subsp. abscessus]|nr:hypothetical protein E3G43_001420 [Mycobacteroides abscessus]SHT68058.1 Uncharacterised protein [Mycobacteroides abscessus subsp. abscessus]SIA55535.1 Uncharacterised protein [Mycobacteroides abscessus subsp. abscessus]SIE03871.1 Uncharacterised protein [Mycobacteroides abscessus subsp. abscessus]SIJ40539.1 Uncharacterised protein [Mycobacteroides abscessus subsp. abscessus]
MRTKLRITALIVQLGNFVAQIVRIFIELDF